MEVAVSIIVPVYNAINYIDRCIKSLLNQSLQSIEIILVDDASTDGSLKILKQYENQHSDRIKVLENKINLRQGGARNAGILASSGTYIGFVDADDWVAPTMFEKLYLAALQTQSDVADCDYYMAFDDKNVKYRSNLSTECGELDLDKKKLLVIHPGRTWTKIYSSSLFVDEGIYFPEHLAFEDNEIMPLLMVNAHRLVKVDEPLYYYYVGNSENTTGKRNSLHHFDRLITAHNMREHFEQRGLIELFQTEMDYRFVKLYYTITIFTCLNKFDPPQMTYLKIIRKFIRQNFKQYRHNPYFIKKESKWNKLITKANDFSPYLAVVINTTVRQTIAILPKSIKRKILKPRSTLLTGTSD